MIRDFLLAAGGLSMVVGLIVFLEFRSHSDSKSRGLRAANSKPITDEKTK